MWATSMISASLGTSTGLRSNSVSVIVAVAAVTSIVVMRILATHPSAGVGPTIRSAVKAIGVSSGVIVRAIVVSMAASRRHVLNELICTW